MTILYSDMEPLSKHSPITLQLSPATRILKLQTIFEFTEPCVAVKYCYTELYTVVYRFKEQYIAINSYDSYPKLKTAM